MKILSKILKESKKEKHYVDAIIISEDEKLLILRRANYMPKFKSMWGFVGGSIEDSDKTSKDAIIREIKEETGLTLSFNETRTMKNVEKITHNDNSDTEYWVVHLETTPDIKISKEHSKYEWVDANDIKNNTYKFIPDVFQMIQKYVF